MSRQHRISPNNRCARYQHVKTVHEVLVRSLKIKEVLHLKSIVLLVFDQALYAKATEIAWKHDKFKDIVIRMGMFHTVCTLLSILGKRFQDAEFITLYDTYLEYLRKSNGKLCSFWMSYIDIFEIMLNLVRASREGHWKLHLSAVKQMIPWCFAYDNLNYARYMSAYLSEMSHLKETHPEVCEYLKSGGGFSVQIGNQNPFGRIPTDQACEETVNKDTQTAGGTKGFSLKAGAVSKYYLVAEYRSIFLKQLKDMLDLTKIQFRAF
ncbi:hypothetical protein QZH41_000790 [Actinostola sp. cb2023]|nr:hypothetical protein QZH41_000790 [Actinostola sp. cb2023]